MPSFSPETLLTVRTKGDEYVGQILRPEKQIWYYKGDDAELKVIEKEKSLPSPLAERAKHLWQAMLLRTKFQKRSMVCDGISYTFLSSAPGYSQLTAESSNPEPGTKPQMLAHIGALLIDYVEASADREAEIRTEVNAVMKRLENALSDGESSNKPDRE